MTDVKKPEGTPLAPAKPKHGLPEIVAGAIAAALGVMMAVGAQGIPETSHIIQASFFPLLIGIGLVVCGVFLAIRGLLGWRHDARAAASGAAPAPEAPAIHAGGLSAASDDGDEVVPPVEDTTGNVTRLLVVIGFLALYAVLIIPVGYVITTFLFLFVTSTYIERSKLLRNAIFSAVFTAVVYLLFNNVLRVILPSGVLEGLL